MSNPEPKTNTKQGKVLTRKREKKELLDPNLENLRLAAETGKIVYGSREVIDVLKRGNVIAVFLAKNKDNNNIREICRNRNIKVIDINTSLEIGQTIGKPFLVSAVAVLDRGESKI
ncbi:MAG: ribosomal L7Ae/L30e/S12e/Gadd45 family protein [Candidatus Micrarchaeota archaeon]|nr:ribosomal L7Ae/L30e/S12e/Gadd45 family protein [Candidatus Micrarchaeota archaeon]MCX8154603.1 ribosomal L7Ae/L30e/S12e/Gadd45 family protein [Candidatus Micrarchaeota archaeon]